MKINKVDEVLFVHGPLTANMGIIGLVPIHFFLIGDFAYSIYDDGKIACRISRPDYINRSNDIIGEERKSSMGGIVIQRYKRNNVTF